MKITLTVTPEEINLIGEGLVQLPYKMVAGLVAKLQQQVNAQQTPQDSVE